ncbi:hypothetical protein [Hydrogenophaga sp.]|uniref:hypothetical protein n=1 Tax=Hydrogenophaga sp. TaxID=1904254 RepID=UPI003F71CD55
MSHHFAHPDVLDNGPAHIKARCTRIALISAYTIGHPYATVVANILAEVTTDSDDFTLSDGADGSRKLTSAAGLTAASAEATAPASATKHFAFLNVADNKVLWVTPEASGQAITAGNPVLFPALEYHAFQPVELEEEEA